MLFTSDSNEYFIDEETVTEATMFFSTVSHTLAQTSDTSIALIRNSQ